MRVGLKVNVPLCCARQAERMVQQWSRVPFQSYDGGCGTNLLGPRPRSTLILTVSQALSCLYCAWLGLELCEGCATSLIESGAPRDFKWSNILNFPASTTMSAAHFRLKPGGLREPHWHVVDECALLELRCAVCFSVHGQTGGRS